MLTYSSGDWHVVAAGGSVAMLPPDIGADTVARVWGAMQGADAFAVVLGELVARVGADMSALPPFVVLGVADGAARVIVRGATPARVETSGGQVENVSALGAPTWTDRTIAGALAVVVGPLDEPCVLPLADGVAAASAVRWLVRESEAQSAPAPVSEAQPAPEPAPEAQPAPAPEPSPAPGPEPAPESAPAPTVAVETRLPLGEETTPPEEMPTDGLGAETTQPEEARADRPGEETSGYDDLIFGETRISSVEDAAVREPDPVAEALPPGALISGVPSAPSLSAPVRGDHDGETMTSEQFAALRAQLGDARPAAAAPPAPPRRRAVLVLSTGERIDLDRSAVVGRRPRAVRATGTVPHLVSVTSADRSISSSHVELRVEGEDVLAVDLDSMNGTRLLRPGVDPVRLHPGQPSLLVAGDRLDLGDGVVLSFEGI